MNSYLLDTHILLWWLSDSNNLSKEVRAVLANSNNIIFVSVVTVWEILIKKQLGKLVVPDNFSKIICDGDFKLLSMTVEHVLCLEGLPSIHKDPFDRLLIAQCLAEDLTFITVDKIILKYEINRFPR